MNVLISVPTYPLSGMRYLPMVYACLKSYHDHNGKKPKEINWLPPIKNSIDLENFIKSGQRVDVLGLSNYMWNSKLNTHLTEEIKKRNPNCFVICGGPEFDTTNKKNFGTLIDLYVPIEGEATFSQLLDALVEQESWKEIGGIVFRDNDKIVRTPPLPWIKEWDHSPLLENAEYMERVIEENASLGLKTLLQFETTRGCPYSCTYCDWGGGIHTKIRQRSLEMLKEEITWTGKNKIWKYFITDANFGILKRDVDIARHIVDTKKEYGFPKGVIYQTAKNQTERIVEVADILYKGTISSGHMMSVQSTNATVLANIKRSNLPPEKQKIIAEMLHKRGVPVKSQIIVGLPGDNLSILKDSVVYLYDMGVRSEVENFIFGLFPNAPASEKSYREKMKLNTHYGYSGILCRDINTGQGYNGYDLSICNGTDVTDQSVYGDSLWAEVEDKSELVISTYSYNEEEWAQMFTWLSMFNGIVELGMFKFISDFYNQNNITYKDFIHKIVELLIDNDPEFKKLYNSMYSQTLKFSMQEKDYAEVLIPNSEENVAFDMSFVIQSWIAGHKTHIRNKWTKIVQDEFGYYDCIDSLFEYCTDYFLGYDIKTEHTKIYEYDWLHATTKKEYNNLTKGNYKLYFKNSYIENFKRLEVDMNAYYYALCLVYGRNRKMMNYEVSYC